MKEYLEKRIKTLKGIIKATSEKKLKDRSSSALHEVEQVLIVFNGGETEFIKLALTQKL